MNLLAALGLLSGLINDLETVLNDLKALPNATPQMINLIARIEKILDFIKVL